MILTPLQKLPKNVEDLGKLIVANGLKKLPKVKKIAQSGHTECHNHCPRKILGLIVDCLFSLLFPVPQSV